MSFNDDEQIDATQVGSAEEKNSTQFIAGKIKLLINNKPEAPIEENQFKVMLELMGLGLGTDRAGVDLVTILDVSESMKGDKLEKMKISMQFIIQKLSPIDRLSIVTFNANAERLCPLIQVTEDAQSEIEEIVTDIAANGKTNITAGLELGLKVINDRTLTKGRVSGVILMSDGQQNDGRDAALVEINDNVPVYTFGFGAKHDPKILKAIADKSIGGTFSDVQNQDNLSVAFAQCLAGLLTVVAQDLKLTVTPIENESTIKNVSAGNYPQYNYDVDNDNDDDNDNNNDSSITIMFGDLYDKEIRKVMVDLVLPGFTNRAGDGADVLEVKYVYGTKGKLFRSNPVLANVRRKGTSATTGPEKEEIVVEEKRIQTAKMMKDARLMADKKMLEEARDKVNDAQNKLGDVVVDESSPNNQLLDMLRYELKQLLRLMKTQQMYETKGRPFALSSETSHDRQRFATRGDVDKLRLFATPRMDAYLEQAKAFDEDPSIPLPTVDEDMEKELAADPLGSIVGALSYFIQSAIQSLRAIENIIKKDR